MTKNKIAFAIALFLVFTVAATMFVSPVAKAHDPPWNVKTYAYLSVSPDPIGIGQDVNIIMWLDKVPPTAWGSYGDRWKGFKLDFTKPDGSKETRGPFTSDPAGKAFTFYAPDQVGTWTVVFSFPGQVLEGENMPVIPEGALNPSMPQYIGDYFEPSSIELSFTVQEEAIPPFSEAPLPTEFWTRPINAQHWGWSQISGNVLTYPRRFGVCQVPQYAEYSTAPESAHILWAKELTIGGLIGGEYESYAYHCGAAYEGKFLAVAIINGVLYYNKYPQDLKYHPPATYPSQGPRPGYYAVDLRTGEEIYYNNDTRISFGQVYFYDSPNQHGAFAYLWKVPETEFRVDPDPNWYCYEAYTGDYVYKIENAPAVSASLSGSSANYGPNGEILQYVLNTQGHWLALWNNTAIPELLAGKDYYAWMWRPHGKAVDGRKGYVWNVSIPEDVKGSVVHVLEDRIIVQSGLLNLIGYGAATKNFTVWALSIKPGQEGQLLWKKFHEFPETDTMATMSNAPASSKNGIFTVFVAEPRKWYAYSLETGEKLWETESQGSWDYYYESHGAIAYDRLYTCGMDGTLHCYNLTTGETIWTHAVTNPTTEIALGANYPMRINIVSDGKIYIGSTIHSPSDPKFRGAPFVCVDAETGDRLWEITMFRCAWGCEPIVADGIIVALDTYDNRIYSFGRGPTKTTVTAPKASIPLGSSVVIEGMVTDESPGTEEYALTARYPNGVPAISDEYMTEWMEHLYRQFPAPNDAPGVPVTVDVLDSNGNYRNIGTTTSDASGTFSYMWTPDIPGKYTVIATFAGSKSYYSSYSETSFGVDEALESPIPTQAAVSLSDQFMLPATGGIIAAIAIVGVALALIMLRKR